MLYCRQDSFLTDSADKMRACLPRSLAEKVQMSSLMVCAMEMRDDDLLVLSLPASLPERSLGTLLMLSDSPTSGRLPDWSTSPSDIQGRSFSKLGEGEGERPVKALRLLAHNVQPHMLLTELVVSSDLQGGEDARPATCSPSSVATVLLLPTGGIDPRVETEVLTLVTEPLLKGTVSTPSSVAGTWMAGSSPFLLLLLACCELGLLAGKLACCEPLEDVLPGTLAGLSLVQALLEDPLAGAPLEERLVAPAPLGG
mmetsp:Transcript_18752/g.52977  ORF Transcript_18752/g.52977 Transcript_18752/m.52977 type:complete len:255 (-) Transcript_18752:352-1116(-)